MNFLLDGGGHVRLCQGVLARLNFYRQHSRDDVEAGGILIARIVGPRPFDVVIDEVTTPMPGDSATRFTFNRDDPGHSAIALAAWPDRKATAIGDWHTHAEPHPTPSEIDLDSWRAQLREWVFEGNSLLFVIVGTESIGMWQGSRSAESITKLRPWADEAAAT